MRIPRLIAACAMAAVLAACGEPTVPAASDVNDARGGAPRFNGNGYLGNGGRSDSDSTAATATTTTTNTAAPTAVSGGAK